DIHGPLIGQSCGVLHARAVDHVLGQACPQRGQLTAEIQAGGDRLHVVGAAAGVLDLLAAPGDFVGGGGQLARCAPKVNHEHQRVARWRIVKDGVQGGVGDASSVPV